MKINFTKVEINFAPMEIYKLYYKMSVAMATD